MHKMAEELATPSPGYAGLRLSAEEYFSLPDDGVKYELLDGVVIVSPCPSPKHQRVAGASLESQVVAGFRLDLARVRAKFEGL